MEAHEKEQDSKNVKKVALPGGKTIEVVYFQDAGARVPLPDGGPRELHVCPSCDSDLAYPTHWSEADATRWEVTLRCPNCEWTETDVFDQETVERFDEELDRGTDQLVDDLKRLVYANMEEQIDRFCEALLNDQILPEDF
jgi:hypothetical protein